MIAILGIIVGLVLHAMEVIFLIPIEDALLIQLHLFLANIPSVKHGKEMCVLHAPVGLILTLMDYVNLLVLTVILGTVKQETVLVASEVMIYKKDLAYFHLPTMQNLQTKDALNGIGTTINAFLALLIGFSTLIMSVFQSVIFVKLPIRMELVLHAIQAMT